MNGVSAIGIVYNKELNLWSTSYSDGRGAYIVLRLNRLRGQAIREVEADIEKLKPNVVFTKTQKGKLQISQINDESFDYMIDEWSKLFGKQGVA